MWHQYLANQGYIVVSVDNRGTGARGSDFKKQVYKKLGQFETADQIAAAKTVAELPYVDSERIGIWGWSYGGYMSSLGITEGADVFLFDADPRRPLAAWAQLSDPPARLRVISSGGERTIQDEIDEAAAEVPFVLVDLEGMASQLATFAMSASDLVIVPAQEQHQDAQAAIDTLGAVQRAGRAARREIPAAVLLTRTRAAVKSRTARHIGEQLRSLAGILVIRPELVERDAFAALFSSGGGLRQLDPREVNGIDKAIANASAISSEIIEILRNKRGATS
jgi:chromosome partitioning protein